MASGGDGRIEGDIDELLASTSAISSQTDKGSSRKSCSDELWRGQYCCVPLCHHSSAENTERARFGLPRISFHSFPSIVTEKARAQRWISNI